MMRIVIVGGGQAGINCAQNLAKTLTEADSTEVVVLEKSGHFYHTLGAARACVDPDYANGLGWQRVACVGRLELELEDLKVN
ncbi:hypothetical protein PInf_011871 [Phytophthora infestans]|nr:hypothetical protein PInf_011871 [Phytophthora infestans]